MQWTDDGIVLGVRRYGESSVILELMTQERGRHLGLVRGGTGRRLRAVLQPGNSLRATWRARLDDHLGNYAVEGTNLRAAGFLNDAHAVHGVTHLSALCRLLAEREPHAGVHDALEAILDALDDPAVVAPMIARFELSFLAELGFGLDLSSCAANGSKDDLIYVSPRSGRAVSRVGGEAYQDKLMRLPSFLSTAAEPASAADLADAFTLTGFFLSVTLLRRAAFRFPMRASVSSPLFLSEAASRSTALRHDEESDSPESGDVQEIGLREALEERYLAYALSTIMHRALPDARDGLKPVHRRILYGMRLLRLDPGATFKKSAKIVGDVMGNFHPHGDQAIYDALVRLAQDFASRYPLVDGQGNFGNIDGDNAAAYRYTEARLTEAARLLLDGIDEDAVDFRPNYDGVSEEPAVLPAAFPNLLANGAQGIAVGMATSIPPHNIAELCDAALHLIDTPNGRSRTLLKFVPGPDFPTGGVIVDTPETIAEAYTTGRGSFRLRARWTTEDTGRGTYQVVVTEIPWQVQKMRLVERIAELMNEKKLPFLADMRDESAEDVRLVFEPRSRSVDPALLMESLFKLTELESRVPLNMNVLVRGRIPKVVGLAEALSEWLTHRRDVLLRRSRWRLNQIEHRLEVLGGYLVAYLNLDKVIKIIRTEDEPKPVLIKTFKLTEVQAEAILNMRLRNLRRLEEMEIRAEEKALRTEKKSIEELLRSEKAQWKTIAGQVRDVRDKFSLKTPLGKRRTTFAEAPAHDEAAIEEALVEREPVTIVVSEKGWIRALRGQVADLSSLAFKADDSLKLAFFAETTSKLLVFATNGRCYTIEAAKLPGGRGHGEPIRLYIDMEQETDVITVFRYQGGRKLIVASKQGRGFIVPEDECLANTRKGKQILNVKPPDAARAIAPAEGELAAAIGENRKMLVFPIDQVPEMTRGRGVRLQRHKDGGLSDLKVFEAEKGLTWTNSAGRVFTLSLKELADWRGNRADAGRLAPKGFPKTNKFDGR